MTDGSRLKSVLMGMDGRNSSCQRRGEDGGERVERRDVLEEGESRDDQSGEDSACHAPEVTLRIESPPVKFQHVGRRVSP